MPLLTLSHDAALSTDLKIPLPSTVAYRIDALFGCPINDLIILEGGKPLLAEVHFSP